MIYDANGNSEITICARCGQSIKYVYTFNGKNYGSECICHVLGVKHIEDVVIKDNKVDAEATKQKTEVKESRQKECNEINKKMYEQIKQNEIENQWIIKILEATRQNTNFRTFNDDMIDNLKQYKASDLTVRQLSAIANIYAKYITGKTRGKLYDEKFNEFYDKI